MTRIDTETKRKLREMGVTCLVDALEAIAGQATLRGTGARGLRAIMEEVLLNVMYDVPSRKDVGRVVINDEVVSDNVNPTLLPREAPVSTRRTRHEKSA